MKTVLVWFRRDLRLADHAALSTALQNHTHVIPVFILDRTILDPLPREDRRIAFILDCLAELKTRLQTYGSDLVVRIGDPQTAIPRLAQELQACAVYANRDYEPDARTRDAAVASALQQAGIDWFDHKDQVLFEQAEILTASGKPYGVFTPYWRNWRARLGHHDYAEYLHLPYLDHLEPRLAEPLPTAAEIGFTNPTSPFPAGEMAALQLLGSFSEHIAHYKQTRDYPALAGTSSLSPHLRFGTVSIRACARQALASDTDGAECWLKELCWREFYQQLLWHRPDLVTHAFQPTFDKLPFPNRQDWFAAWCAGNTGYPLVDAGMRQLNQTGWMHNRVRMVVASFLVKDLLIDWRWGERYFAEKLLDYDLASNNGGWQWSASVGCDAQPWFRIFNPISQSLKFDPDGDYIRQYCPELSALPTDCIHAPWQAKPLDMIAAGVRLGIDYPPPIVDHAAQRLQALDLFKSASSA